MRWSNVFVIFRREVRDQLRDKRTLFMIFVLPILLYPILGISVTKFADAFAQEARTVLVLGPENLPDAPPLLDERRERFHADLFDDAAEAGRLKVEHRGLSPEWIDPARRERTVRGGAVDAVVVIPTELRNELDSIRSARIPIVYDSTHEKSQITYLRLKEVLARWKEKVIAGRLAHDKLPASYTEPIHVKADNVATQAEIGSTVWSKIFPFLLVMMSLTGAFYPAIDLCAGEKERGTMETLLISPASRAEIVLGKFFTVVFASIMTALLNLVSMGLTGMQMAQSVGATAAAGAAQRAPLAFGPPSLAATFWMLLLLIPLAVFFSALCLSLAILAKSMKEGQYYMTPLYLVCLPLIFLTLAPGIELNLFYSIVPITGVSLLLRALIQGDYELATRYFLPVLVPTVLYGAVALRWAIDQFEREDVLFREAERFDLKSWVRHLLRDKEPIPRGGEALFCFALMLTLAWFMMNNLAKLGLASSSAAMAGGQIAFILTPPLAMALLLTSSPRRTLRLYWPSSKYLALGVGLALGLNPLVNELRPVVEMLFPMSQLIKDALAQLVGQTPDLGTALLLFAVVPAICEELAFRGYILSGLEHGHSTRQAVLLSALLFGFLHVLLSLFQQLFNATLLGVVLGLLAVRSRSIVPGIVFHMINNGLAVALAHWVSHPSGRRIAAWLFRKPEEGLYHGWVVVLGALISCYLLTLLGREDRPEPRDKGRATDEAVLTAG